MAERTTTTRGGTRDRESRETRGRQRPGDERDRARGNGHNGHQGRLSGSAAVQFAKAHLAELTGKAAETVSSLTRSEGGWTVTLEVVELERIPQSTDILASYQVQLDEDGELMSYERVGRYYRNQSSSGEE